jgi:hypothetical protein
MNNLGNSFKFCNSFLWKFLSKYKCGKISRVDNTINNRVTIMIMINLNTTNSMIMTIIMTTAVTIILYQIETEPIVINQNSPISKVKIAIRTIRNFLKSQNK